MVKVVQNSFLAGQLDFEMMGRQDFAKYQKGASVLKNFNIVKRGGIEKRNGFDRLLDLTGTFSIPNGSNVRLVPFAYEKDMGFVLLFAKSRCWAIGTVKGYTCRYFEVSNPAKLYFTNDEVKDFDYAQCGYRMFIAHENHPPSEIRLDPSKLDEGSENPFTWTTLDIGASNTGIPSITGVSQVRQAPRSDTAGGTYTERYKVSAVFDGLETKPCEEFFSNECIEPISLGTDSNGCQIVQKTKSTQTGNANQSTSTTTTVVANTRAACNGTKYYMPWVESQVITLSISAVEKDGKLPELVNIYKKSGGVFGLIGTARVGGGSVSHEVVSLSGDVTEIRSHSASSTLIDIQSSDDAGILTSGPADEPGLLGAFTTGYRLGDGGCVNIGLPTAIADGSKMRIYTGKIIVTLTSNHEMENQPATGEGESASGEWEYGWKRPTECTFKYVNYPDFTVTATGTASNGTLKTNTCSAGGLATGDNNQYSMTFVGSEDGGIQKWESFAEGFNDALSEFAKYVKGFGHEGYVDVSFGDMAGASGMEKIHSIAITSKDADNIITGVKVEKTVENDGSTFTFEDNNISPDTSRTPIDSRHETPFQKDGDYPRSVCVAQQRLVFASTKNQPETLWMSAVGDFTNFSEHEVQNVDDSIEFSLPVTRFAKLNHIVEMKQLIAFNSACEWVIESTSTTQGITYETICARPQSYSGTNSRLKPLVCDNSVLFAERTGQAVRRYAYDVTSDGFAGRDVSVLSSSIFDRNCIVDWTYQQFPFSTVWCVLLDGTMASFTFMEEQDIMAWATHRHAGGRVLAVSTSHAVAPGLHEITQEEGAEREEAYSGCSNEEVFIVLKDKNDGKLYLERMRPRCKGADSVFNALCLDSMELGTSATDGRVQVGDWVGYPIESEFTSVYPVVGDGIGVGQLDVKGIVNVGLRLKESHGGRVKAAADPGEGEPIRYGADVKTESGGVVTLRNHDADNIKPRGCNSRDGRITVKHGEPWPFGIISLETDYAVES